MLIIPVSRDRQLLLRMRLGDNFVEFLVGILGFFLRRLRVMNKGFSCNCGRFGLDDRIHRNLRNLHANLGPFSEVHNYPWLRRNAFLPNLNSHFPSDIQ